MTKILLIDGNSLFYRAYFGSALSPAGILTNSQGMPVNALLTFTRMLEKTLKTYHPTHVFVAFDAGAQTYRHQKLPSYKAGRAKTPTELIQQLPLVKKMLDLKGIKHFELPQIEADDLIGTLATKFAPEHQVLILSSDRDLYQLVTNEQVKIVVPQNRSPVDKIVELATFESGFGYLPTQVVDFKALVGDASDNLKGVAGIGPKSAINLLKKFNDLDNIYANLALLAPSQRTKLIAGKASAFLCQELATLKKDVPIPLDLAQIAYHEKALEPLINFFKALEINSLVKYFTTRAQKQKTEQQISFDNLVL